MGPRVASTEEQRPAATYVSVVRSHGIRSYSRTPLLARAGLGMDKSEHLAGLTTRRTSRETPPAGTGKAETPLLRRLKCSTSGRDGPSHGTRKRQTPAHDI